MRFQGAGGFSRLLAERADVVLGPSTTSARSASRRENPPAPWNRIRRLVTAEPVPPPRRVLGRQPRGVACLAPYGQTAAAIGDEGTPRYGEHTASSAAP